MNRLYVGVDVGKNGGIVAIYPADGSYEERVTTQVTPVIGKGKGSEIDGKTLRALFKGFDDYAGTELTVVIENVHSIFGVSAGSNFQFGRALGLIEGLLMGMGISYVKVAPKEWQSVGFMGVPVIEKAGTKAKGAARYDNKAMALIAAQRLYPNLDLRKSQKAEKAHDGIVDALLMGHYAKVKGI